QQAAGDSHANRLKSESPQCEGALVHCEQQLALFAQFCRKQRESRSFPRRVDHLQGWTVEHEWQDEKGERQARRASTLAVEAEPDPPQDESAERWILHDLRLSQLRGAECFCQTHSSPPPNSDL